MYDFEDTKTAKGNNKKHIMRVNWKAEIEMKNFSLDNTFCRKKSDDYGGMQLLWIFFIFKISCTISDHHRQYLHQFLSVVFFLERSLYSTLLSIFDDCINRHITTLDYIFSHQHFNYLWHILWHCTSHSLFAITKNAMKFTFKMHLNKIK